jgi:hypothetical protein
VGASELRMIFVAGLVIFAVLAILVEALIYRATRGGSVHGRVPARTTDLEDGQGHPARSCRVAVYRAAIAARDRRARSSTGLATGTSLGRSRAGR